MSRLRGGLFRPFFSYSYSIGSMTFTGAIGTICMFPLRAIIALCVKLRIHPNVLTFTGVVINALAAVALAVDRFPLAGGLMVLANIFDFIDGKVAQIGRA